MPVWEEGRRVRSWMKRNSLGLLVGLAFCFLWPYYQRSYYRVTLFYQLGERAGSCFALFAVVTLAAWFVAAMRPRHVEAFLERQRWVVPVSGGASLVSTVYLSGAMVPGGAVFAPWLLDVGVTLLFATCLFVVSAFAVLMLMRTVYEESLFVGVLILVGGGIAGRLISPSFLMSPLSTGFAPVCGVAAAALVLWAAARSHASSVEQPPDYLPFGQAPHKGMWLAPLVAYVLLSLLHAVAFLNDATTEMHTSGGQLLAAPFSMGNYAVFLLFSLLFVGAAANALRAGLSGWKKSVFWVAAMGVAVGLFCGSFLMSVALAPNSAVDGPSTVTTVGTMCLMVLLSVTVLFMTYQNRLAPLCSFGLFFFGVYTLEKVLTYVVFPFALTPVLGAVNAAMPGFNVAFFVLTLAVLLLFLLQLCRTDALLMLFSDGMGPLGLRPEPRDGRAERCGELARAHGLTAREADILYNLSLGHSARHVADSLCISERTVQTHVQNVYRKLGVHTRQEVIDLVGEGLG